MKTAGVVDEWALMRGGVEMTLRRHGLATKVSTATLSEYVTRAEDRTDDRPIDVVVVGHAADSTQVAAVRRLAATGATVIVLSVSTIPSALIELCAEGAFAVVGRNGDTEELSAAVQSAIAGDRYVAPGLLSTMFATKGPSTVHRPRFDLTDRERQVLSELASGLSNDEISARLLIGTQTVKTHLSNIYDKLGVRRRTQAARLAVSHGLV